MKEALLQAPVFRITNPSAESALYSKRIPRIKF